MTLPRGQWAPEFEPRVRLLDGIHLDPMNPTDEAIAAMDAFGVPMGPGEDGALAIEDIHIDGPHGPVRLRVYQPSEVAQRSDAGFIWLHGGGFIGGDLDLPEADEAARGIAARSGATVFSVDYRLCVGGVHHPVPHDDCWAAFTWVRDNAAQCGLHPERIAVGGASAGGNLAASVALRARDEGAPLPLAVLVYPILHPQLPPASAELTACLEQIPSAIRFPPTLTRALNENYLGGPESSAEPSAFPGLAEDLTGFAPCYVEAAEFDDLRSSAERFAAQLRGDGVEVEYVVAAGVPHGHLSTVGSPYARASFERIATRLTKLGAE